VTNYRLTLATLLAGVLVFAGVSPAQASNPTLNFFISPPTVQNTFVTGAKVATFNTAPLGACPTTWVTDDATPVTIGTITTTTGGCVVKKADQFGGAALNADDQPFVGGAITNVNDQNYPGTRYVSIPRDKSVTLTLSRPETYLGFWWSAGDSNNKVELFSGGTRVGVFTTANLVTMLDGGKAGSEVTAINGDKYPSCRYFGNPIKQDRSNNCTGTNTPNEPFAYVHLIGQNGLAFDTLVFSEGRSGAFEFDNMAIARDIDPPPLSIVSFPPDLNAGEPDLTAQTCTAFSGNFVWTASNFSTSPAYTISPTTLPDGLVFNEATGNINGTPLAPATTSSYTVTATAGSQVASATVSLTVTDLGNTPCPDPPPPPSPSGNSNSSQQANEWAASNPHHPELARTGSTTAPVWAVVAVVGGLGLVTWARLATRRTHASD